MTKQIDFKSYDNTKRQGISFSDYAVPNVITKQDLTKVGLSSVGNDLFNWCNDITKLYVNVDFLKGFRFHADAQIFWKWQGLQDGIKAYDNMYNGVTTTDATTWATIKKTLDDENIGQQDIRMNVSLSYKLPIKYNMELSLFASNLLETKRYVYNSGESSKFPSRIFFYKEPRIIGFKLNFGI